MSPVCTFSYRHRASGGNDAPIPELSMIRRPSVSAPLPSSLDRTDWVRATRTPDGPDSPSLRDTVYETPPRPRGTGPCHPGYSPCLPKRHSGSAGRRINAHTNSARLLTAACNVGPLASGAACVITRANVTPEHPASINLACDRRGGSAYAGDVKSYAEGCSITAHEIVACLV